MNRRAPLTVSSEAEQERPGNSALQVCYRELVRSESRWLILVSLLASAGCGGSGSLFAPPPPPWAPGVFPASVTFANRCAVPRTGIDPLTGVRYPDVQGSTLTENDFLRSWTNELYLWYSEVPDLDPALYATPAYFNLLKTSATTPSGSAKDKFHFTYPTAQWEALSQSGVSAGYGAQFTVISSTVPRLVLVAYTEPNTAATRPPANLARGAEVLTVDGVDVVNATGSASVATLNAGLFPTAAGVSHTFSVLDAGATTPRTITMVSANVTSTPVQGVETLATATGPVGYMLFNDHIATAEQELIAAFGQLKAAQVSDLVLDIRYNGGGYLDIASEVAYMIAGPGSTAGKTFEETVFNNKHPTVDPVTGRVITPVPFHPTSQGFSGPSGQALPTLNLTRVAVLTGANTCSASEAIINSLRGVGVEVFLIGATTCGKPYGFYPQDNCGTTYFSIEFKGVNDQGFGDYPDGFSPANATGTVGVQVPGCAVADDFTHALGDSSEGRLAAALGYLASATCPAPSSLRMGARAASARFLPEGVLYKSPWLENRILRR